MSYFYSWGLLFDVIIQISRNKNTQKIRFYYIFIKYKLSKYRSVLEILPLNFNHNLIFWHLSNPNIWDDTNQYNILVYDEIIINLSTVTMIAQCNQIWTYRWINHAMRVSVYLPTIKRRRPPRHNTPLIKGGKREKKT